jgi:hypothetical protein
MSCPAVGGSEHGDRCRDHTGDRVGAVLTLEAFVATVTSDGTTAVPLAATLMSSNNTLPRTGRLCNREHR